MVGQKLAQASQLPETDSLTQLRPIAAEKALPTYEGGVIDSVGRIWGTQEVIGIEWHVVLRV
jgi:hypothetical protein